MQIGDSIALVTGANRGLGLAFTRELVRRGAARVYGAARQQDRVTEPGVTPAGLDITDQAQVAAAAARCADVSLLVNNAGVMKASTLTGAPGGGPRRRAHPHRKGQPVPRPRADLPAHPAILGRRHPRRQLASSSALPQ